MQIESFNTFYLLHPFQAETPAKKAFYFIASLALGVLTLGTGLATLALYHRFFVHDAHNPAVSPIHDVAQQVLNPSDERQTVASELLPDMRDLKNALPPEIMGRVLAFTGLPFTTIKLGLKDASPLLGEELFGALFESFCKEEYQAPVLTSLIDQAKANYANGTDQEKVSFIIKEMAREARSFPGGQDKLNESRARYQSIYAPQRLHEIGEWIQGQRERELIVFFKKVVQSQGLAIPFNINANGDPHQQAASIREWMEANQSALGQISDLDLSSSELSYLPPEIKYFTGLDTLDLSYNKLTQLPKEIGNLTQLTELRVILNKLTQLPAEIGNLTQLTWLNFHNNRLTQLPAEIGNLTLLTGIDLSENQLTQLPKEIGNLTQLTWMELGRNKLTQLPAEIGSLTQLLEIDLYCNELTQLPAEIGNLTLLTRLDLSYNQLTQLPAEIRNLILLTQLQLNNNRLMQLPKEIGNLTQLTELDLRSNQLTQLPAEIGSLTQLTKLDLSYNRLTQLPEEIENLTELTVFTAQCNRLPAAQRNWRPKSIDMA